MKKNKRTTLWGFLGIVWGLFLPYFSYSHHLTQQKDSILHFVQTTTTDSAKVYGYFEISKLYNFNNSDSVLFYAEKIDRFSHEKGLVVGRVLAEYAKGNAFFSRADFTRSLQHHLKAITLLENNYQEHQFLAGIYAQLVTTFAELANYPKAEEFSKKGIASAEYWQNKEGLAMAYNNWGDLMDKQKRYAEAIPLYKKSLALATEHNILFIMAFAHFNLGSVYRLEGKKDLREAEFHVKKALEISKTIDDTEGMIYAFIELAHQTKQKKDATSTRIYLNSAAHYLRQYPNQKLEKESYFLLSGVFSMQHQPDSALVYYKKGSALKDSLFNEFSQKLTYSLASNQEIQSLQQQAIEKEAELSKVRKRNSFLIMIGLLFLAGFVGMGLFYWQRKNYYLQLEAKNRQIEQQKEELSLLNDTKDKLISVISHDLRVPLNQVKGLFSLLGSNAIGQTEFKTLATKVQGQIDSIIENLENSLHWVTSQIKGITVNRENVHIEKIAQQVINLYENALYAKGLSVTVNIPPCLIAQTDKEHLHLALRNLFANAIKFSHQGKSIELCAEEKDYHIHISVIDKGVGMSQHQVHQLMNNGKHFSTLGTSKERGTGLGLKLSKEFIEKSGGQLKVESEEGKGSAFTIVIPKND
ncbi:MAG: ATP-binding protein [Bacteroidia bacterium]